MKMAVNNQKGLAHIALVLIIVVGLGCIGLAGYKVVVSKKDDAASNAASKAIAEAKCDDVDRNICKFQAGWKAQPYYTITTKMTGEGVNSQTTYQAEGQSTFHVTATGETAYEMIIIDDTTYTKSSSGIWWKKTSKSEEVKQFNQNHDFSGSSEDVTSEVPGQKITYKALGTEGCGRLTCYKYQVIHSANPDDKEFIWFDTKDYLLRRTRTEAKDGTISESTFSYSKVSITIPSPVKDLASNQYLVPGQAEPQTMPNVSAMQ